MDEIPEDVMEIAKRMLASIDRGKVYVGDDMGLTEVTIDGSVNFIELASIAIVAERQRCAKLADEYMDGEAASAAILRGDAA